KIPEMPSVLAENGAFDKDLDADSKNEVIFRKNTPESFEKLRVLGRGGFGKVVSPSIVPSGNFTKLIRTVTCMVLKVKANDRRISSPLPR
ncbi:hypothetical protein TNCV_3322361, partial [Trichonephila clavipes]